ncbi:hypothetical protein LCGC14_0321290 [marine sediment metagenome]|uniref:Uncharacterized protein n=1 Tax=marine sediment metagenome TaxID=412755 RepID=A0A0F9U1Y9_9ZZZZ|nr:hypothetical protein [Phycisphaerae bacterium]HDZ43242.1 hypothetical protein [Phycisphaerae bacterium]
MTKHDWAVLACKVLALWMLSRGVAWGAMGVVGLVVGISEGLFSWTSSNRFGFLMSIPMAAPAVVALLFAWVLWTKADRLAVRMMGPEAGPSEMPPLEYEGLLSAAMATIGVLLLVLAIPQSMGIIVWAINYSSDESTVFYNWRRALVMSLTQIVLGLWLTVGTKQVVRLLRRLRTFGVGTAQGPPEA